MTSESMVQGRRNTVLAAVIGTVLASYAGGAAALEFEFDNGTRVNWNTTISVGTSWRAEDQSRLLYTYADGALLGRYGGPLPLGVAPTARDGMAGNNAASSANLNYDKGDQFSTPFKLITDVEVKQGNYGGLLRVKAWYDYALNERKVNMGSQVNNYNGVRPGLGPIPGFGICSPATPAGTPCFPLSPAGQNLWPRGKLSDDGFEDEQKFDNVYLLDAYVYGSFAVGDTDLQLRLGNQVVNWGESVFIQGVNQINPIDVPAARRAGAELKEILLPVWMAYANWGFSFGSVEAFYQLQWNNTSVDGCGNYWAVTETIISVDPGRCNSATVLGNGMGAPFPGTASPLIPQLGSNPFQQAIGGTYAPLIKGREPGDSGQFGFAFRFPVDMIDTEIGLYAMNIHSRLPVIQGLTGTNPLEVPEPYRTALGPQGAKLWGQDAIGPYWLAGTTRLRGGPLPVIAAGVAQATGGAVILDTPRSFWEYTEDMQIFGISAATNLVGWSVSAEASYQKDVPVQINGNDLVASLLAGIGPNGANAIAAGLQGTDTLVKGYELYDKTQFQVNTVKTFSNILGAANMLIVGEIGMQINDLPDYKKVDSLRFGRGFMYGTGSHPIFAQQAVSAPSAGNFCSTTFAGLPTPVPSTGTTLYNPSSLGCRNDGYITDAAWGYRLRVSADYLNVLESGVTVTPSVFWSHDVDGISMDPQFIEDRQVLGLGMKFTYNKKYVLDFNWVDYADNNFDPLHDRDYYSASVSVTF